MSNFLGQKALFETAKTSDHTGAGATYSALGTPLSNALNNLIITSTFDESVWISFDGTNNHVLVPALTTPPLVIDFASNKQLSGNLALSQGTQLYLMQGPDGAPTEGDISVTGVYQP